MKEGSPILMLDGTWALIEKVEQEHHPLAECFVDVYTLRRADGGQSRISSQDLPIMSTQAFLYRTDSAVYAEAHGSVTSGCD